MSNPLKPHEFGLQAGREPHAGEPAEPPNPIDTASTVTEDTPSEKLGDGVVQAGYNPGNESLDRVRVDSGGQMLTTNQGVPIADNQNSLKAGLRGPTVLEDFILREKITHFDHERIPGARGPCARLGSTWLFRVLRSADRPDARRAVRRSRQADAGLRALLDRARRARRGRPDARRARLRGQVLYRRRQLGPGRQQHPGLLHPGRDEVPRPRPRRQARAASPDAAGRVGARHVLGLRRPDARDLAHADVGDVGPRDPAQLPDDAGLRRAHLPARQRGRRVGLRQVPLESGRRHALGGLGRGGQDQRRRFGLPSPRPVGSDRGRRVSGVRARAAGLHRGAGGRSSRSTCSTRPRSCPKSWCRCVRSARWC